MIDEFKDLVGRVFFVLFVIIVSVGGVDDDYVIVFVVVFVGGYFEWLWLWLWL